MGFRPLQIQVDEAARRREFPVCAESVFLAHAAVCPLPHRVSAAVAQYASDCARGDQEEVVPTGLILETRRRCARLLRCLPEEVALVGPTSIGLSLIVNGLDWREGDNVVFYSADYPSNVVPWMALKERGVEPREIQTRHLGEITLDAVRSRVDRRTRLVALASAHFISGYRLDLDAIGEWVRSQGILFAVDGIQTLGALQTSIAHADFLAADSHKWLLGPCAAGIFYVRRESQDRLRPTLLGWNNLAGPGFTIPEKLVFPRHAGRYEAGTPNLIGIVGLHAALGLLLETGMETIEATILDHTRWLRSEIQKRGYELAGLSEEALSGITAFRREGADLTFLHRKLKEAKIVTSLRQSRDGRSWLRVSPHFYNTRAELEEVVRLI